jgi:succinoglycan biosynthesis protein ExoA
MPYQVTIIIPTLNEERYLERCIRSLVSPQPPELGEIFVVDGGSSDRTIEIAQRLAAELPAIRILDNPARIQSAAFNLAMEHADPSSTALLRCDAHAEYAPGFVSRAMKTLKETGAGVVGFAAVPAAEDAFQRAVAFAQSTPVGVGGSQYRQGGASGWVDSAMHGCFSAAAVRAVGGYDETFTHNEDSELSLRLRQAGYGVWLDAELRVSYFPRDSITGLARQYWLYGRGRARSCLKHRVKPRARQAAPVALALGNLTLAVAARRRRRFAIPIAAYAASLTAVAAREAAQKKDPALLLAAPALATMHHAWGLGFLVELLVNRSASGRQK